MARMTAGWPRRPMLHVIWQLRRAAARASRRWGWGGFLSVIAFALLIAVFCIRETQRDRRSRAYEASALEARQQPLAPRLVEPDARARLQAFDRHLVPHEEIAVALQDLIALAESTGLVLARGAYRPQPDPQGGYLRYRMTLPVIGPADAIHRFVMTALGRQRSLSLESVQFKRERSDSAHIEARIQWALLARLPASSMQAAGAPQ